MKLTKFVLMGVLPLGLGGFLVGCGGGGAPVEVTAEEDEGTTDEGLEEMDDISDVEGLEDVEQ